MMLSYDAESRGITIMRNAPVLVVDPSGFTDDERESVAEVANETQRGENTIDLDRLPDVVADQLRFALDALQKGEIVAAITDGKPLTTTEAAKLLGMSRSHLLRLCDEGRVVTHSIGSHQRIPTSEVVRILQSRANATADARTAAASAEVRRRARITRRADQLAH